VEQEQAGEVVFDDEGFHVLVYRRSFGFTLANRTPGPLG
jgi:hypothetical protein